MHQQNDFNDFIQQRYFLLLKAPLTSKILCSSMRLAMSYYYETPAGTAEILFFDGRWNAIFSGRRLSTHHCPTHAAEQVGKAHIYVGEKELHLSHLNIPSDPNLWKRTVVPLPAY